MLNLFSNLTRLKSVMMRNRYHKPETYKPKFHCRRQSGMNFGYVTVNGVNSNNYFSAHPFSKIQKTLPSRQTRRGASQTLFVFKKRALVHLSSIFNCIFQPLNRNRNRSFLYSCTSKIAHIQCQSIIIIYSNAKSK